MMDKSETIAKEMLKLTAESSCTTVRILSVYFRMPGPRTRTERSTRLSSSRCFSTLELRLELKLGSMMPMEPKNKFSHKHPEVPFVPFTRI